MMTRIIFSLSILLLIQPLVVNAVTPNPSLEAKQGLLDIRDQELDGNLSLNGEWEFFWMTLLTPDQLDNPDYAHHKGYIHVPQPWAGQSIHDHALSNHGYGTYRLHVLLPDHQMGQALALKMPSVASAYKLWINGKALASNGIVGPSLEEMEPANLPKPVFFTSDKREVEIVIQVSNFVQRKGGLWSGIQIGPAEQIIITREKNIMKQIAVSSALLIMGIYHIGLYAFRRSELSILFFGMVCLFICLRTLLVEDILWFHLWPNVSWEIAVKLEYLSAFLGIAFFVLYSYHLHAQDMNRKIAYGLFYFITMTSLPILILPARIYTQLMVAYQLILLVSLLYVMYALGKGLIRKREGAWINFAAMLFFILAVLNDILYYNMIVKTGDFVGIGLFTFIFAQNFVLASRFAASFFQVETLSKQLKESNANLEQKVKERTLELEESNQKLKQVEASRKNLLTNISHELGSPLTSLIGYIFAMQKGIVPPDDPKYAGILHNNGKMIMRLVDDLKQLVQFESKQISYFYEPVNFNSFFHTLCDHYKWEAQSKEIECTIEIQSPIPDTLQLNVDAERIQQVVANLISNALEHTDQGGSIVLSCRYFSRLQKVLLSVRDTGIGIDPREQAFVFERYYKGERKRREGLRGNGLGLAISKEIIQKHKGRIGVLSKPGKGSLFYFILPTQLPSEHPTNALRKTESS